MRLKRKYKILLVILLFFGVLAQGATMFRSGLIYDFGMGFWGPNGHDAVWHLALANQVLEGLPPPHPTLAGFKLTNYHYFYDLLLGILNKLTMIPIRYLYFQIFPILLALGLGWLSFLVGYYWRKDFWTGFWLAFFNYFAGSFGFLITLWRTKELGGESLFWSMQSISTLINPSFALSLVVLLAGILGLLRLRKGRLWQIISLGLLFGIFINIKVYAGIIALPALFVFALFKKKKEFWLIFLIALITSLITFLLINREAVSLLVFQPFWFIHTMIETPDRLYLPRLAVARYAFTENKMVFRLFLMELGGLIVFLAGNLGMRIVGLVTLIKKNIKKDFTELDVLIMIGGALGFLIPLVFVQKGTAWNTIQFFYYCLFFANFYAAVFLADFYNPFEKQRFKQTPIPLYVYETTAYVSAFSNKQTFLEDEMNLIISGYDFEKRAEDEIKFFTTDNEIWARGFLLNNQIGYIYLVDKQEFILTEEQLGVDKVFENDQARIYQVRGII